MREKANFGRLSDSRRLTRLNPIHASQNDNFLKFPASDRVFTRQTTAPECLKRNRRRTVRDPGKRYLRPYHASL